MNNLKQTFLIVSLIFSVTMMPATAADLRRLTSLFKQTFWTNHYKANLCGQNIEGLVAKAVDSGIDLTDAHIVRVTDDGGWMYGMINALAAREAGRPLKEGRSTPPLRDIGENNWYFHVFLLAEGQVLDYDFTNQAKIVPLKQYLFEMFVPAPKVGIEKYKRNKMGLYKLDFYPAEDYLLRQRSRVSVKPITTSMYLRDYMPEFFTGN